MPYFLCRLATEDGHHLLQTFLASSVDECRKHFEREGFCVLSVKKDWKKTALPSSLPFQKKVKDKDFIMFNQELMALLRAGYPVLKSLELVTHRTKNANLKEMLTKVAADIRAGKALSEAFIPYEKDFSKVYTASLLAGEQSGNLPGTIARYVDYAKVIAQTKSKIRAALAYPTLLLIFSLILMGILINFILPRFSGFYADFEAELPAITRFLVGLAGSLRAATPYFLVLAAFGILVLSRLKRNERASVFLDKMKLKIPFARRILTETAVSLFSRTLGLLLEAGITLLPAIPIASQAIPNRFLRQRTQHLPDDIRNGQNLSDSLSKAGFFSFLALDMVRIGETSANLHGMLREVSDVYDERIRARIDTLVSLVEPVIIIFMGLAVAMMLLAVYLPIFNIIRITR
ncbi:MAG: type II secretion system F family protein [Candidatus Aminicenantes bacterium]|nr:type II secretion system F family protein [Candidatus Aminicenantes bacterium]